MATYRMNPTGFAIVDSEYPTVHNSWKDYTDKTTETLILKFGIIPTIPQNEYLVSAKLYLKSRNRFDSSSSVYFAYVYASVPSEKINVDTITYKTMPRVIKNTFGAGAFYGENTWNADMVNEISIDNGLETLKKYLDYGIVLSCATLGIWTPDSDYSPYIEITTTTTTPTITSFVPECKTLSDGGNISQEITNEFYASCNLSAYPQNPIEIQTVIQWKCEDGIIHEVFASDSYGISFFIPPMTLPQGTMSVRSISTTSFGSAQSAWMEFLVKPAYFHFRIKSPYYSPLPASDFVGTPVFFDLEESAARLTNATIRWREKDSSIINSKNVSDGPISFQAGTFKANTKYEFQYVSAWSTGITSTSSWDTVESAALRLSRQSPQSGFADEREPITFSWYIEQYTQGQYSITINVPSVQNSAVFKWKATSSGTIRSISVGQNQFITVAANTFPNNSFYWSVDVTAADGTELSSEWYYLETVETATSSAVALAPFATIVDGSASAEFKWSHIINTGTLPTKSEIQIKTDTADWATVKTITGSDTTTFLDSGALPAGKVFWRVRTYNTENVAGSWSEPAEITVIAAPSTPVIRIISATPHFVVGWATDQQKSFEIMLNGDLIAAEYSEMREYTHQGYIPAGSYAIDVRSQNEYGMWSQWGKAMINIANTPGESISLVVSNSAFAVSLWFETAGDFEKYQIIKDGAVIGETTERSFVDQFATVDPSSYKVRGILANGNYSESPAITAAASVSTISIFGLDDREWIPLRLSAQQMRATAVTFRRQTALTHYTGTPLPSIEYGEQQDFTYQFACAFRPDDPLVQKFDRLFTQPVILKDPHGTVIAGALSTINKSMVETHIAYTCTVSAAAIQEVDVNG